MALTATMANNYPHSMGAQIPYEIDLADSGNYTTDGDTIEIPPLVKASRLPLFVEFDLPAGYTAQLDTSVAPNKVLFFSAAGTQLVGAAPYPAGLTGVKKTMRVWVAKNL